MMEHLFFQNGSGEVLVLAKNLRPECCDLAVRDRPEECEIWDTTIVDGASE